MDIGLVNSLIDVLSVHFIVYKSSIIIFIACNLTIYPTSHKTSLFDPKVVWLFDFKTVWRLSLTVFVDEIEEDHLEHEEQEDLCSSDYPEDNVRFLVEGLKIVDQVEHQKGYGVYHAVDHQYPVQPRPRNYAQKEDQHKTTEGVAVYADQLHCSYCTSGSLIVSHFIKRRTKYSRAGTPNPMV